MLYSQYCGGRHIAAQNKALVAERITMSASAVICELNPLHSGHAYLLSNMREAIGPDGCIISIQSGAFVQRGTPAIADPYVRAEMALAAGADLVLELPFPWSAASAESFAAAGVRLAHALGAETLTFGSETGDLSLLSAAAKAVSDPRLPETYATLCRRGMGTTAAYREALRTHLPADIPTNFPASNDLLGIAYLCALDRLCAEGADSSCLPFPRVILRRGAAYREETLTEDAFPSATALRSLIHAAAEDPLALATILEGTMPTPCLDILLRAVEAGDAPCREDSLLSAAHVLFRLGSPDDLARFAELGGGLAAHLVGCARSSGTASDFFAAARTKQYTDARLRRALLFALMGVTDTDLSAAPSYTVLLGATPRGRAYLAGRRKACATIPVVTKPADAPLGRQRTLAERTDALFTLCMPVPRPVGALFRRSPVIVSGDAP